MFCPRSYHEQLSVLKPLLFSAVLTINEINCNISFDWALIGFTDCLLKWIKHILVWHKNKHDQIIRMLQTTLTTSIKPLVRNWPEPQRRKFQIPIFGIWFHSILWVYNLAAEFKLISGYLLRVFLLEHIEFDRGVLINCDLGNPLSITATFQTIPPFAQEVRFNLNCSW